MGPSMAISTRSTSQPGLRSWQRNLGSQDTNCGDIPDTIFGVSGSPFVRADHQQSNVVVGGDGNNMRSSIFPTGETALRLAGPSDDLIGTRDTPMARSM